VSKAEIEARLRAAGAMYAADLDDLHELWVTAWGFEITVRCAGPFGTLDEEDLVEIELEIRVSRP
jgi:hypothetical protein